MTPARGAACDEVGLTRDDEDISAYEQQRSRNILENRNVLRELGWSRFLPTRMPLLRKSDSG